MSSIIFSATQPSFWRDPDDPENTPGKLMESVNAGLEPGEGFVQPGDFDQNNFLVRESFPLILKDIARRMKEADDKKKKVSIVIAGNEGVGKSVFAHYVLRCLGKLNDDVTKFYCVSHMTQTEVGGSIIEVDPAGDAKMDSFFGCRPPYPTPEEAKKSVWIVDGLRDPIVPRIPFAHSITFAQGENEPTGGKVYWLNPWAWGEILACSQATIKVSADGDSPPEPADLPCDPLSEEKLRYRFRYFGGIPKVNFSSDFPKYKRILHQTIQDIAREPDCLQLLLELKAGSLKPSCILHQSVVYGDENGNLTQNGSADNPETEKRFASRHVLRKVFDASLRKTTTNIAAAFQLMESQSSHSHTLKGCLLETLVADHFRNFRGEYQAKLHKFPLNGDGSFDEVVKLKFCHLGFIVTPSDKHLPITLDAYHAFHTDQAAIDGYSIEHPGFRNKHNCTINLFQVTCGKEHGIKGLKLAQFVHRLAEQVKTNRDIREKQSHKHGNPFLNDNEQEELCSADIGSFDLRFIWVLDRKPGPDFKESDGHSEMGVEMKNMERFGMKFSFGSSRNVSFFVGEKDEALKKMPTPSGEHKVEEWKQEDGAAGGASPELASGAAAKPASGAAAKPVERSKSLMDKIRSLRPRKGKDNK